MKNRRLLGIACLLCLAVLLAGCSADVPEPTLSPTQPTPAATEATAAPDPIVLTVDEAVPPAASGSDTAPLSAFEGNGTVLDENGTAVAGTWRFAADQDGMSSDTILPEKDTAYTAVFLPSADPQCYTQLTAEIVPEIVKSKPEFHLPTTGDLNALFGGELTLADLGLNRGNIYPSGTIRWLDENGQELSGKTVIERNKVYTWSYVSDDQTLSLQESVTLWPSFLPGETVCGNISYKLYVPDSYTPGQKLPLYLYLHGCGVSIDAVLTQAGLNAFAEENDCLVLLPQQSKLNNKSGCWNWFEPDRNTTGNLTRSGGEPERLMTLLSEVRACCSVDSDSIYVGGISAGGYMANVLAVTYPDIFSGVMVNSGGAYCSNRTALEAFSQMYTGVEAASGMTVPELAEDAWSHMGEYARVVPMVIVQGTKDNMVVYQNGLDAAKCWAETLRKIDASISTEPVVTTGEANGSTYTLYTYYNEKTNQPVILLYMVDEFGHMYATPAAKAPDIMQISFDLFTKQ